MERAPIRNTPRTSTKRSSQSRRQSGSQAECLVKTGDDGISQSNLQHRSAPVYGAGGGDSEGVSGEGSINACGGLGELPGRGITASKREAYFAKTTVRVTKATVRSNKMAVKTVVAIADHLIHRESVFRLLSACSWRSRAISWRWSVRTVRYGIKYWRTVSGEDLICLSPISYL